MGRSLQKGERIGPMRTCVCGSSFYKAPSATKYGRGKYCSLICKHANQPKKGLAGPMSTCVCGTVFYAAPSRVAGGKGKFCSLVCKRANMTRRSGLTYRLKIVNSTWFKPGGKPLHTFPRGERPHNFKCEGVGYDALHDWVRRHKGKPKKCERCPSTKHLQWANVSWEYKRDLADWMSLCSKCHHAYDRNGGWGLATLKFPELQRRKYA